MDGMAITVLAIPVVFPVIVALGFDPVWFGVIIILMGETALLTPPVGLNVFIVHGVTKVPLGQIFRGSLPFFFMMILCIALLVSSHKSASLFQT